MNSRNAKQSIMWIGLALLVGAWITFPARGQETENPTYPPSPLGTEWDALEQALSEFPDLNREAVMNFITREFPDELREFKELSVRHLSLAIDLMNRMVEDAIIFLEARQRDPALFDKLVRKRELEKHCVELAQACRQAEGEDKAVREAALRETLAEVFELKQEFMRADVARMENELNELKGLITKREGRREGLIGRRLEELLGEQEVLPW